MSDSQQFLDQHGLVHGARECSIDAMKVAANVSGASSGSIGGFNDDFLSEAMRISCVDYSRSWYGNYVGNKSETSDDKLSDSINNEGAQHQRFESAAEAAGAAGAACVTATAGGEGQSTTFKSPHILLDVRPSHQFEICSLPGAINIPLKDLKGRSICCESARKYVTYCHRLMTCGIPIRLSFQYL